MEPRLINFHFLLSRLLRVFLVGIILFSTARVIYFFHVLSDQYTEISSGQIILAFLTGLRFDSVVIAYGLIIPLLLALSTIFIKSESAIQKIRKFILAFCTFLFVFFSLILIIDYYYYIYFQSHINILFLGIFEDDTNAVLKSVWSDYPLLRVIIFLSIIAFFYRWLFRKIFHKKSAPADFSSVTRKNKLGWIVLYLVFFIIALRASFGTFPVQIDDAVISNNTALNLIPVNGVFSLKEALGHMSMQTKLKKFDIEIKKMNYSDPDKAYRDYFGKREVGDIEKLFFAKTDTNEWLKKHPPNVVFFLMESMSNNNLDLQSDQIDVYGRLKAHLDSNIFFRKFLPNQNGTINTLEAIMVNTPITSLAQSKYCSINYPSSIAKPFVENGYTSTFVTGGKINWRNIQTFIPNQDFMHVEGDADIILANPATQVCEWGVYDEYLFNHVFSKLEAARDTPQFIFALTTTNHTPFHLPPSYKPQDVVLTDSIRNKLKVDEELAIKNLKNFQYSNDCLGKFLDRLESSPLKNNTIVVATGDHNNIMLFDFTDEQTFQKLSVPMFMYVPKDYLSAAVVDTSRWGSHNDIFPTVFNLALSGANYFNSGNNLLERNVDRKKFIAYDIMSYVALNDAGCVFFETKMAKYLSWDSSGKKLKLSKPNPALRQLMFRAKAHFASYYHYIISVQVAAESEEKLGKATSSTKSGLHSF